MYIYKGNTIMASVIEHRKFCFTSAGLNSNKYWGIKLYDNDDVEVEFGKISDQLSLQRKTFKGAGRSFLDQKVKEKTRPSSHYLGGCYKELETVDSPSVSTTKLNTSTTELKKLATKQIATCPVTEKLVSFFTDINAHDIYQATNGKIKYDASAGTFRTPLGIITKHNIDEARAKLDLIGGYVSKSKLGDSKFVKTLEEYLMLVPQDVGRKFSPVDFIGTQTKVQAQNALLDGLDASYSAVIASATKDDGKKVSTTEPVIFNVKMSVLTDKTEFDRINKLFNKTRQSIHYSAANKKLVRVYTVSIDHMNSEFAARGAKMSNIWELWHGTKASNALSLLKRGFIIPPESASYVCGRNFGNGVYFSDQSTKSLQYATSHWGGKDEGKYFMFLSDVAMGKYYVPKSSFSGNLDKAYDSVFAKAGETGYIQNNEMIVPKTDQIKPNYLCEFSD